MSIPGNRRRGRPPSDDLRETMLASAACLFADRGVVATSTRDVAGAAATTERTLYKHFGSKDGLVEAVLERAWATHAVAGSFAELSEGIARYDGNFRAWHCRLLADRLDAWRRSPELARLLLVEMLQRRRQLDRFGGEWAQTVWRPLVALFERLQRETILRADVEAAALARQFLSVNISFLIVQAVLDAGATDERAAIEAIADLYLVGAGAAGKAAGQPKGAEIA